MVSPMRWSSGGIFHEDQTVQVSFRQKQDERRGYEQRNARKSQPSVDSSRPARQSPDGRGSGNTPEPSRGVDQGNCSGGGESCHEFARKRPKWTQEAIDADRREGPKRDRNDR